MFCHLSSHRLHLGNFYTKIFRRNEDASRTDGEKLRERGFEVVGDLGTGAFGTVSKAVEIKTGQVVAIKIFPRNQRGLSCPIERNCLKLLGQASTSKVKHPNIIQLIDVFPRTLVFECLDMDLETLISANQDRLKPILIRRFMQDLLQGLRYCHEKGIVHRDIKPNNLLINLPGSLKIADFGLAISPGNSSIPVDPRMKTYRGTLPYRPPEVLLGSWEDNWEVDIWGAGCVFFEMIDGDPISLNPKEAPMIIRDIMAILGTPGEETQRRMAAGLPGIQIHLLEGIPEGRKVSWLKLWPRCHLSFFTFELLERLLAFDPVSRISARDALRHLYFYRPPSNMEVREALDSHLYFSCFGSSRSTSSAKDQKMNIAAFDPPRPFARDSVVRFSGRRLKSNLLSRCAPSFLSSSQTLSFPAQLELRERRRI